MGTQFGMLGVTKTSWIFKSKSGVTKPKYGITMIQISECIEISSCQTKNGNNNDGDFGMYLFI